MKNIFGCLLFLLSTNLWAQSDPFGPNKPLTKAQKKQQKKEQANKQLPKNPFGGSPVANTTRNKESYKFNISLPIYHIYDTLNYVDLRQFPYINKTKNLYLRDEIIQYENYIISCKKFYDYEKKNLCYELNRIADKRFYYREFSDSGVLMFEGSFMKSDEVTNKLDTAEIYNYEGDIIGYSITHQHYANLYKNGTALEYINGIYCSGNYKQNNKEGEWLEYASLLDYKEKTAIRVLHYKQNLIEKIDTVNLAWLNVISKDCLIGRWSANYYSVFGDETYRNVNTNRYKKYEIDYGTEYVFRQDGTFSYSHQSFVFTHQIGTWQLQGKNILLTIKKINGTTCQHQCTCVMPITYLNKEYLVIDEKNIMYE